MCKKGIFQRMKYRMPCQHTSCLIHCLGKTSRVTQKIVLGFSEVSKEKQSLFISFLCHDTPLRSGLKTICFPRFSNHSLQKGKIKFRISESMVRRWRARTTTVRNRKIVNKAVTSKAHHDMTAKDFIPLWRS